MPRICTFYGIAIYLYYDESRHEGRPHFHAVYRSAEASIEMRGGSVLAGGLPPRALRLVQEWTALHVEELLADWELARQGEPLLRIPPLP
jgi:hypothetical protein